MLTKASVAWYESFIIDADWLHSDASRRGRGVERELIRGGAAGLMTNDYPASRAEPLGFSRIVGRAQFMVMSAAETGYIVPGVAARAYAVSVGARTFMA